MGSKHLLEKKAYKDPGNGTSVGYSRNLVRVTGRE